MVDKKLKAIIETWYDGKGIDSATKGMEHLKKSGKDSGGLLSGQFGALAKSAMGIVAPVASVGAALMTVKKIVVDSVADWMAYNQEMRMLSSATGAGAEDLSRLVQAADDAGVSIEGMEFALRLASQNGITPTIENMAKLSDRLLLITDATKRADEMQKIFGRGWAEIAPFILQGGEAIRQGAAAIDESLVVTAESIAASEEYRKAVDDLGDAWTGFKNTVGAATIPILTDLIDKVNELIEKTREANKQEEEEQKNLDELSVQRAEYGKVLKESADGTKYTTREILGEIVAVKILDGVMRNAVTGAIIPMTQAEWLLFNHTVNVKQGAMDSIPALRAMATYVYNAGEQADGAAGDMDKLGENILVVTDESKKLGTEMKKTATKIESTAEAADRLQQALNKVPTDLGSQIMADLEKLDMRRAGALMIDALRTEILGNLEKGLITQSEAEKSLAALFLAFDAVKVKAGELSQDQAWNDIYQNLKDLGIPAEEAEGIFESLLSYDGRTIDITALIHLIGTYTGSGVGAPGTGYQGNTGARSGGAGGSKTHYQNAKGADYIVPPGYPNDTYPVGWAQSGERVTITPRGQGGQGGETVVNLGPITVYETQDAQATANAVVAAVNRRMRAAAAAGAQYSRG